MPEKQPEPGKVTDDIAQKAAKLYTEQSKLQETLLNLELQIQEHTVVIESLEKLDSGRRCFRRMSGVLVERTVGQVLTAIKDHLERLKGVRTCISCMTCSWRDDRISRVFKVKPDVLCSTSPVRQNHSNASQTSLQHSRRSIKSLSSLVVIQDRLCLRE
jgi:chaperonin cofactor prefoldin